MQLLEIFWKQRTKGSERFSDLPKATPPIPLQERASGKKKHLFPPALRVLPSALGGSKPKCPRQAASLAFVVYHLRNKMPVGCLSVFQKGSYTGQADVRPLCLSFPSPKEVFSYLIAVKKQALPFLGIGLVCLKKKFLDYLRARP